MYVESTSSCCGVHELFDVCTINNEEQCKQAIQEYFKWNPPASQAVFMDAVKDNQGNVREVGGKLLAAYIRKHKIGRITTLPGRKSYTENHDTTVQTWLWSPPRRPTKFMKELGITVHNKDWMGTDYGWR